MLTVKIMQKVRHTGIQDLFLFSLPIFFFRFTALAPDSVHDDHFPKNLCLKVNNKVSLVIWYQPTVPIFSDRTTSISETFVPFPKKYPVPRQHFNKI